MVAIPAYNEGAMISDVVRTAGTHADTVLVIDDGSSDDTGRLASEAGADVVRHPTNRGYGGALKTIFREAARRDPAQLIVIDADGQHDPSDISSLLAARVETQADLVIGSRYRSIESSIPSYRRLGLWLVNGATNLSLGTRGDTRIADTQSGLRAYSPRAYRSLATDATIGDGMSASTDILYHVVRRKYRVVEVGVTVRYDLPDTSTENPLVHGFELMWNIGRLTAHDRPGVVLTLPIVLVSLLGLPFARRFRGPASERQRRWTATTLVASLIGVVTYLLLKRPRTVSETAEHYELQVRRTLRAEDGREPDVDVTRG
ncbi:glycosyltransferase family 2 protein [Halapricum desulfuricans]|nr:glycosyltransferase family 2 protein [Halapricum desulfuricans]